MGCPFNIQLRHRWPTIVALAFFLAIPAFVGAEDAQTQKEVYNGYLHPKDRYHYDLHDVRTGEHVRISLSNVSGNLDPFIRVSLREFSFVDDDSGPGSDAVIQFVAPRNGTYDIEISPYEDATFGEYSLTVERTSTEPAVSPLATLNIERSHPSVAVQELLGSLINPGDFYEHELTHLNAGHTLYIFVESLTPGLELEILLKDFQRKVLSDVLPDTETHIARIAFPIIETGDHYDLVVKATDGKATGDYRLLLGIDSPEVLQGKGHNVGDPIIREPKQLRVGFELQQLTEIDQQSERFGVVGIFRAEWTDHNLAFDASDHETTTLTYADRQLVSFLEQNEIDWPDFRIVNQQTKVIQHRVLNIDSDGHVFYEERFTANLQAPEFDFRKFPFDYQDFWIRIETIEPDTYATLALHENPEFNSVGKQLGEEEWVIHEALPVITDVNGHYRFSLDIKAKRHATYYIFRILFPMALIVLIGWGIFFIFDHNTQIAAASGNLLVFIAFNFTVGDSLPRLGYLTFLDSIMLIGFLASITSLLLALYLKRIESDGRTEYAKALEQRVLHILPASVGVLVAFAIVYFFVIL